MKAKVLHHDRDVPFVSGNSGLGEFPFPALTLGLQVPGPPGPRATMCASHHHLPPVLGVAVTSEDHAQAGAPIGQPCSYGVGSATNVRGAEGGGSSSNGGAEAVGWAPTRIWKETGMCHHVRVVNRECNTQEQCYVHKQAYDS